MKNLFSFALILLVAGSAFAFGKKEAQNEQTAQLSPEEAASNLLSKNDTDKDGKLAKNEVNMSFRIRRFKAADTNLDNYLDQAELTNWFQKTTQIKAANTNVQSSSDEE